MWWLSGVRKCQKSPISMAKEACSHTHTSGLHRDVGSSYYRMCSHMIECVFLQ